uniref:Uncharacterized protein n=1 Tax=Pararge aegeria TaxID=116150 RepID=S4PCL8_9NEOP
MITVCVYSRCDKFVVFVFLGIQKILIYLTQHAWRHVGWVFPIFFYQKSNSIRNETQHRKEWELNALRIKLRHPYPEISSQICF